MATLKKFVKKFNSTPSTIQPLKSFHCPTLSGSGKLEYALGMNSSGHIHFQIVSNDSGGFFSKEHVGWKDIQPALQKIDPITSPALRPLFKSQSANNAGFLMAVLVKEGLLAPLPDKTRHFKLLDPAPFLERVAKLAKSTKPATSKPAKKPAAKKAPPKKKAK